MTNGLEMDDVVHSSRNGPQSGELFLSDADGTVVIADGETVVTTALTLEQVEGFSSNSDVELELMNVGGASHHHHHHQQQDGGAADYLTLSNVGACVSNGLLLCNGTGVGIGVDEFDFGWGAQPSSVLSATNVSGGIQSLGVPMAASVQHVPSVSSS
jgi:hypothetical protein